MTFDPEAKKATAEQEGQQETPEASLFELPEVAETLMAQAGEDIAELEAGGLPSAEHIAKQTGTPVDAETMSELGAIVQESAEAKAEFEAGVAGSENGETPDIAESIDSLNTFTSKYEDRLAAGEELSDLGLSDQEYSALHRQYEDVSAAIRSAPEDAETLIDAIHPALKGDFVWQAAEDLSKRDPDAATEFYARKSAEIGEPMSEEEVGRKLEMYRENRERVVQTEVGAQVDTAIASGEWDDLVGAAIMHGKALPEDWDITYTKWQPMTKKFIETAVEKIGKLLESDLGAAIEAYRRLPESSPVTRAVRYEVFESARRKMPFDERLGFLKSEVETASEANSEKVLSALNEKHGKEKVEAMTGAIDESKFFAVNVRFDAIAKIVEDGRFKSSWETGDRAHLSHLMRRDGYERVIGIRAKGTEDDPHPAYGAVGFENGRDEKTGPTKYYGDCQVQLKQDVVQDRAIFLYGDLGDTDLGDHRSRQFSYKDVAVARTKVELDREAEYVEMQILGGIRLADIDRIVIPKKHEQEQSESVAEIRARFPDIRIVFE